VSQVSRPLASASASASPARATVTNPEAESFNEQGKRAYEADELETAIAAFRQALALDPTNADYQTNLAVALDEQEMDEEAFAAYTRALELNPRQVTALLNIGYLYSEQERFEEARQVWEQVIRVDPASEEAQEARDNLRNLDEL
jgi:superkiller protein 3